MPVSLGSGNDAKVTTVDDESLARFTSASNDASYVETGAGRFKRRLRESLLESILRNRFGQIYR
jgi:hypothetical protein